VCEPYRTRATHTLCSHTRPCRFVLCVRPPQLTEGAARGFAVVRAASAALALEAEAERKRQEARRVRVEAKEAVLAAQRTTISAAQLHLEQQVDALTGWLRHHTQRFTDACAADPAVGLGADYDATCALLSALREDFRPGEKPPRHKETDALKALYAALLQQRDAYVTDAVAKRSAEVKTSAQAAEQRTSTADKPQTAAGEAGAVKEAEAEAASGEGEAEAEAAAVSVEEQEAAAEVARNELGSVPPALTPAALDSAWKALNTAEGAYEDALIERLAAFERKRQEEARRVRVEAMLAALAAHLEQQVDALTGWLQHHTQRFTDACAADPAVGLGADYDATCALLSALHEDFRPGEKPPRHKETDALKALYASLLQQRDDYVTDAVAKRSAEAKTSPPSTADKPQTAAGEEGAAKEAEAEAASGEGEAAAEAEAAAEVARKELSSVPPALTPAALDSAWMALNTAEGAYEDALSERLADYPVVAVKIISCRSVAAQAARSEMDGTKSAAVFEAEAALGAQLAQMAAERDAALAKAAAAEEKAASAASAAQLAEERAAKAEATVAQVNEMASSATATVESQVKMWEAEDQPEDQPSHTAVPECWLPGTSDSMGEGGLTHTTNGRNSTAVTLDRPLSRLTASVQKARTTLAVGHSSIKPRKASFLTVVPCVAHACHVVVWRRAPHGCLVWHQSMVNMRSPLTPSLDLRCPASDRGVNRS
jgi:hypothetical protein